MPRRFKTVGNYQIPIIEPGEPIERVEFVRLTVLRDTGKRKAYEHGHGEHIIYECLCVCGNIVEARRCSLLSGSIKSCGCLKSGIKHNKPCVHGHASNGKPSAEYRTWSHMIQRCTNPGQKHYEYYGGRGISVCSEWIGPGGFERFIEHV